MFNPLRFQRTNKKKNNSKIVYAQKLVHNSFNLMLFENDASLRGGGCGNTKISKVEIGKLNNSLPVNFAIRLQEYTTTISEKSFTFQDKLHQDEILSAFQWFYNNKEYFQIICNNDQINSKFYQLVEKSVEILLKSLIIYIKLSGFLFHQLLDICNDLFRVIFSYQLKNEERYMQENFKQNLFEIIAEIESQISIESTNIYKTGVEFEIQLIKICLTHCRTNSEQEKELIISVLCGAASSISELKPSSELIDSLIDAGKYLLLNFYDKQIQHPLQKYEIYYFLENLKWSIINQLKLGYSVQKTINPLLQGYNQYIKSSQDWMIHSCWIKFITDLMSYRPIINKEELKPTQSTIYAIWNQLITTNQIIQLPYDKSSGKLQIFGKKNSQHLKQFKQLTLFQEYLLDIQEKFELFPAYSKFEFNDNKKSQADSDEFLIKLLISESVLGAISILNGFLKTSSEQLTNNFEQIAQQFSQTNKGILTSTINDKIFRDDISYLIKQIKIQWKSILFSLYEMNILINQDRESIAIISNILQQNKQFLKENLQKSSSIILEKITQLEQLYSEGYQLNVDKFPQFFIQLIHKLSVYKVEAQSEGNDTEIQNKNLQKTSFDQKSFNETVLNINVFLKKYQSESQSIKKQFSKICVSKDLKNLFNQRTSLKGQSQAIIKFYNLNMIQKIAEQFFVLYFKIFDQQKDEQLDLGHNQIWCHQIKMILKVLKIFFQLQQNKIASLIQRAQVLTKDSGKQSNQTQNQINFKLFLENLISEKKFLLQNLLNNQKENGSQEIESGNLQEIISSINEGIEAIQQECCPDDQKQIQIIVFQEVINKLQILELKRNNQKQFLMEILQLFDRQVESLNQEQQLQQSQIKIMSKTNEIQQQDNKSIFNFMNSQNLFHFEEQNQQIQELIQSVIKIQMVMKQKKSNFQQTVQFQQTVTEIIGHTFNKDLLEIFSDMNIELTKCFKKIQDSKQTVFNDAFLDQLSDEQNLASIHTLQIVSQNAQLFQQQDLVMNQEIIIDKAYSYFLEELDKENQFGEGNKLLDIFQDSSYKVREAAVFNLIKMQSIVQESAIKDFCQTLLQQIWMVERHASVRNILKNKEMIEMQKQLYSKDLANFSNKLKIDMQNKLKKLEQLETQVLIGDNKTLLKNQLQQAYEDFESYIDNITEMSQKMDISLIFLREISKDLKSIKSSIDQVLQNMKGIENDLRRLSGKSYTELLQIRKDKILQQKQEAELDQVHIQFITQEYDPLTGKKKENNFGDFKSHLISKQYNNYEGEVNEFLWSEGEKSKDVMLLKGKAGSGKSRASRNIEEFLWINESTSPSWIPIFVSLPSLKNPKHNLIEQTLESQNYNFDKIQIREFKQAVTDGYLNVVFLFESYDEMKIECIQSNLYQTNRFATDLNLQIPGKNVKFIITTREEILTSIGYQTWFYGKNLESFKEVELLPFNYEQSSEYIKQYCEVSIKRTVRKYYEFLKQLKGQNFSLNEFKLIWTSLEDCVNTIMNSKYDQDMLFQPSDVEKIIQKFQTIEFFNYIRPDQMIQLRKELLLLWSSQKFSSVINNVNINHLMGTPFMMEIIVYVLPKMSSTFSESNFLRDTLKQKYLQLKYEAHKQNQLIEQYQHQPKVIQVSDLQSDQAQLNQKSVETKNLLNQRLLENFLQLIEELESQNFFENYSISHPIDFLDENSIISRKVFTVSNDANFIVSAFKLNQFTAYDFYDTFSQFYHMQQLQKWKELGKAFNYETTLKDLHDFSLYLALDMTTYQLAQVDYQQKGLLQLAQAVQEGNNQQFWEDQYFDENSTNSEYYGFLKKCILLRAKGSIYSFSHKSIQEFFVAKYILSLFKKVFQDNHFGLLTNSRFNLDKFNISLEHFQGAIELLKPKLKQILDVKQKLILIVQQSKKDIEAQQVRSASNTIYLLSSLRENLNDTDLTSIQLSDTKLNGLNFCQSNLDSSYFNNISIDSCNFNCAKITNALWKNLICKEKPTLIGHKDTITSLQFTKDGRNVISGSKDGTIKIWQVSGEIEPKTFSFSNNQKVISTSFSEQTNLLACLTDQSIQILNCSDLILENYLPLINYDFKRVMLSQDGKYIAALTQSLKIYFWRIESLKNQIQPQRNILTLKFTIECTAISQSSKLLAVGGAEVILFSMNNFSDQQQIAVLQNSAQSLNFSSDEQILAVADKSKKINFWNVRNRGKVEMLFSLSVSGSINKLLYSADDKYLFSRDEDTIKLYDRQQIMSHQDIQSEVTLYKNISKQPFHRNFNISKNSQFLAIATTNGIIIKNIEQNQIVSTLEKENDYNSVQFVQEDELLIISASWYCSIEVYDIKDINNMKKLQTISMPFKTIQVTYLSNSKQLLINNNQFLTLHTLENLDNKLKMIQIEKSNNYNFILINENYFGICKENQICFQLISETVDIDFFLNYEKNEVLYANFSSDGSTFSIIFNKNCFNKYSIQNKQIIKQEKLQLNKIKSISLNKQETLAIVIQKNDQEVKLLLYDIQTNKALQSFEDSKNNGPICIITSFSPDGGNFFTGHSNGTIKLWDTKTCKLLSMFQSNTPSIAFISISNKGTLAQASSTEIKLWNITALQQQQFEMDGHSDSIQCFSKSPDGLQLVSCSNSEIIRWDLQEYKLIDILLREQNLSSKISFSSDSVYFAALDQDNQINVWKLNTKYIIERQFKLLFSPCISFSFSLQKNQIISEHISKVTLVWDLEKFTQRSKNQDYILKKQQLETILISPDQSFYISKQPLQLVNIGKSKIQEKIENVKLNLQSKLGLIAISKDSTKIAFEDMKSSIIIWSVPTKQEVTIFKDEQSYDFTILSMAFSGDSKLLLSIHGDEFYRLWNLNEQVALMEKGLLMESLQCFSLSVIQVQSHKNDDFLMLWSQKQIQGCDEYEKLCFSYYKIKEPKTLELYSLTESGSYSGYEEKKKFFINFTIAYAENKKLLAVQWLSYLKIFDLTLCEELIVLEGNSQNKSSISSILQFVMDEKILLGLGRDHFLRCWDLEGSFKINLKQKISAKAFLYNNSLQVIKVLGQDNQIYDFQIENFSEVCRINNRDVMSNYVQANYELSDIFEYQIKNEGQQLEIIDKKTKDIKYTLDKFSSEINCVTFSIDQKQCLLGMKDGSILVYDIDKITTAKYGKPICIKIFGKSPLLQADCCNIKWSKFLTQENENFEKLLCEKGAIS